MVRWKQIHVETVLHGVARLVSGSIVLLECGRFSSCETDGWIGWQTALTEYASLTTRKAAWYILTVVYHVWRSITFESFDAGSSYLHSQYISREYGSSSYMKAIGSELKSQEQRSRKSLFPPCKTSIGHNSGSVKESQEVCVYHGVFAYGGSKYIWPPSLSRDQKWPRVTKCTHSRVVGLGLEDNLVNFYTWLDEYEFITFRRRLRERWRLWERRASTQKSLACMSIQGCSHL